MPDTYNSFLASLMAAMENNDPTDEALGKGPKDGSIENILNDQNDPSGNSGSPGTDSGTPVGKDDPDAGELEGEIPSIEAGDDPSGNAGSPGDGKGTPATELFSFAGRAVVKQLDDKQVYSEFIKAFGADNQVVSTKEQMTEMLENSREVYADYDDEFESNIVACGAGYALVEFYKNGRDIMVNVQMSGRAKPTSYNLRAMRAYLAKYYEKAEKAEKLARKNSPAAAEEGDGVDFAELVRNITTHGAKSETELDPAKDGHEEDPDGPGVNGNPVSPGSDSKPAPDDTVAKNANCPSGNPDGPGVNGTPVSKSGDSKPLPKTQAEIVADDKSGNPPSPGVNGTPAPGLDSFIAACEQLMIEPERGIVNIPDGMSLESYATQLGFAEIASRALEADLTAAERRALSDSEFGLPAQRKWPLNDESHVRSAIQNFHWCPQEDQRELAKNILKAMKKFNMKDVEVSEGNPFLKYYPEAKVVARKKPTRKAE